MQKLAAVLLLACALASAQPASKAAKIDRLLELTHVRNTTDQILEQMKTMATLQMPAGTTPEQRAKVQQNQDKLLDMLKSKLTWDKLRPSYVRLYDETFSEQEIEGMLDFYQSPAGKALIEKMPLLIQKSMALASAQVNELMPEIQRLVRESQQ